MRVRTFVTFVSGVLIALFVVLFAVPVYASTPAGVPVACGNGWTTIAANPSPDIGTPACDRARAVRKAAGVVSLGVGIFGLCAVYLTRPASRTNRTRRATERQADDGLPQS